MRVVVAEDVMLTREGIVHVLTAAGIEVAAQASDASGLLRAVTIEAPDIAVVDIRMPPTHTDEGITAARRLREIQPGIGVLVLSQFLESTYALELLEDHPEATGYLLKDRVFDSAVLVDTLNRIMDGETVVDPTIVARLFGRRRRQDPLDALTPREKEVLSLVAEGLSNKGIADRLYVTERTVEAHVTQVFLKLALDHSPHSHRRVMAVLAFLRT
ncbi:MAG: response regulator transcription factor [Acidimicrobiia bacterium]